MNRIAQPARSSGLSGRGIVILLLAVLLMGGGTTLSYYVDSQWFASLGFSDVFWTTLLLQGRVFVIFFATTFVVLYLAILALKPARLADLETPILINGQPLRLPVEPVMRLIAIVAALLVAGISGLRMMAAWTTFALYWNGGGSAGSVAATPDPIFGRPLAFYFFTLPV
jgi:uncharacterized membrane protein (UPF0182 family)